MITLKFPSLEKALLKNTKHEDDLSPKRGILVLNNQAIVYQSNFCFVVNLKEYFLSEEDINDPEEIEELERILFFMNGKVFSSEYWKELTKGANMKMNKGLLYVKNPNYAKDLHYEHIDVDYFNPLENLRIVSNRPSGMVESIALDFGILQTIYSCLSSKFKGDHIILDFTDQSSSVKFTFKNRKHFYGYIMPDYTAAQDAFKFESMTDFVNSKFFENSLSEAIELKKASIPPPPPKEAPKTSEEDGGRQLSIVS